MANHKIKIEGIADFSSISKELDGLQKTVQQSFGKKGAKLIDESSLSFLKKDINSTASKLKVYLGKLKAEAKELNKELAGSGHSDKKSADLSRQRRENIDKMVSAQKELNNLSKFSGRIDNGGELPDNVRPMRKFGGMAGDQIKDVASRVPVLGEAVGIGSSAAQAGGAAAEAGLGIAAIGALGLLAVAAGVAAIAISRMSSGFEAFKAVVPNLMTLGSMGVKPIEDASTLGKAAQLGYDETQTLDIQKAGNQAFGKTTPGQDQNRLINILTASRSLGISPSEITSGGNQLRASGGTEMANKQISMILEKAIITGMDKTQSSAYLAAAVGLLSELNQNGVSNGSQMMGVMAGLVGKGMSPEQAARSLGGINSSIANSSGESNAFFQGRAANAGLGNGTLLGTQFAVRQGLMGVDAGALGNQIGDTKSGRMGMQAISEMGLDDPNYTQKFSKSILDDINSRYNTNSKEGRMGALGFVSDTFGTKTAAESAKVMALLEKMSKPGNALGASDKKLLEDLGKDPDANWRQKTLTDLDSLVEVARDTAKSQADSKNAQIELGKTMAPIFNRLTDVLTNLDNHLAGMGGAGIKAVQDEGIGGMLKNMALAPSEMFGDLIDQIEDAGDSISQKITKGLEDAWDYIEDSLKSFVMADPIGKGGELVDAGLDAAGSGISSLWGKAKDALGMGDTPSSTNPSSTSGSTTVDNADVVGELKKTNLLLEKSLRQQTAPRAGRDPSRQ